MRFHIANRYHFRKFRFQSKRAQRVRRASQKMKSRKISFIGLKINPHIIPLCNLNVKSLCIMDSSKSKLQLLKRVLQAHHFNNKAQVA